MICIDKAKTVLDKAAVEFTKYFYDELFDIDASKNICNAFACAKTRVEKKFGKGEGMKYMLLKNEEFHGETCSGQDDERLNLTLAQ